MISLLEVEAALYAYYRAHGKSLDLGEADFAAEVEAMRAALAAAEAVRSEDSKRAGR